MKASLMSNYPATCKFNSSRHGKEVVDSRELSVTDDPLAGDDDDDKFELSLSTFSNQRVRRSGSHLLHFFEKVFFVLSAACIGTPNVVPIQQQLYNEHLFRK